MTKHFSKYSQKVKILYKISDTKMFVECLNCMSAFEIYICKVKHGRGKYCSKNVWVMLMGKLEK